MKILVADDDEFVRGLCLRVLPRYLQGAVVVAVTNASEAESILHKEIFDVFVSDNDMTGEGEGLKLLSQDWLSKKQPALVKILMSGRVIEPDSRPAKVSFLEKPFEVWRLAELITCLLL